MLALSEILIGQHGGAVPQDRDALEALPGVGRKTANVVLNEAFRKPTIAIDTHIFRVSNRTGLAPGKTPDAVEKELLRRVPERYKKEHITGCFYMDTISVRAVSRTVYTALLNSFVYLNRK